MDKISKALKKCNDKERDRIKNALILIREGNISGLDIKKLKGSEKIFRVRVGDMRIIYEMQNNDIKVISIKRRGDTTYNFWKIFRRKKEKA